MTPPVLQGLILEGVAGTGKSTLLARLREDVRMQQINRPILVMEEDVTLGELVTELADPRLSDEDRCKRLYDLVPVVSAHARARRWVILERFHLSYFALMPSWSLVKAADAVLAELGFGLVLLDVPDDQLAQRSFHRPELVAQHWEEGLVDWYGSKGKALAAFQASQANRRNALVKTRLHYLHLNTADRDWARHTDAIVEFIHAAR